MALAQVKAKLYGSTYAVRRPWASIWGDARRELAETCRLPGREARVVARRVDGFWDAAEGRMVPEPLRHHERGGDGRLTQYLLADPHLPDESEDTDGELRRE